jgi:hypothetical protein
MVRDGSLPGGIEYYQIAKVQDEDTLIGQGTKSMASRKRDAFRAPDAGIGHRAPFFVTLGNLVDLTKETRGNRFGYTFFLTLMCKEYAWQRFTQSRARTTYGACGGSFSNGYGLWLPYVVAKQSSGCGDNIRTRQGT